MGIYNPPVRSGGFHERRNFPPQRRIGSERSALGQERRSERGRQPGWLHRKTGWRGGLAERTTLLGPGDRLCRTDAAIRRGPGRAENAGRRQAEGRRRDGGDDLLYLFADQRVREAQGGRRRKPSTGRAGERVEVAARKRHLGDGRGRAREGVSTGGPPGPDGPYLYSCFTRRRNSSLPRRVSSASLDAGEPSYLSKRYCEPQLRTKED